MAPLSRSYSLPVSLSNPVSRLKALSGAAGRDEVSEKSRRTSTSIRSPLTTSPLATVAEAAGSSTYQRPSPDSSLSDLAPSEEGSKDVSSKSSAGVPSKRWSLSHKIRKTLSIDTSPKSSKDGLGLEGIETAPPGEEERGRRMFRRSKNVKIKTNDVESLTVPAPNSTYPPTTTPNSISSPPPFNDQASHLILGAIDRGRPSGQISPSSSATDLNKRSSGAFAALGLKAASIGLSTPSRPSDEQLNESAAPSTTSTPKASFLQPSKPVAGGSSKGPRAPSPFFRARKSREKARERERSPEVGALKKDNYGAESEVEPETEAESVGGGPKKYRPQASAYEDDSASDSASQSESDSESDDDYADIIDEDGEVIFDEETAHNTEANAVFFEGDSAGLGGRSATSAANEGEQGSKEVTEEPSTLPREDEDNRSQLDYYGEEVEQDPLGEGPNVVVPPQSLFQTASMHQPKRKKSMRSGIELITGRPSFARDRCTITLTHGDPDGALEVSGKRLRRYVVLSDLSEESRYAVEWAIGTVARDGDELFLISVKEDESKVDPKAWSNSDRAQKLRIQKERQTSALMLVKQVTGLLQRTRLNITVTCQFVHAKNARHMLLDLIDFLEPTMCIVGSRGLGKLQGILLGSTSHYLVQKSSVPVMVARRRLQRPMRKTNPANLRHSPRVSLASASIEKTASSRQEDEIMDVAESEKEEAKAVAGTDTAS
uniref:UspA domain-containing protein n=1 Tax=Kwoniella dejecticola CBS 10117 TaxID=1296121 RepID=A0A1A6A2J7_9TREE|nr:uncharacterized protein I303_05126 [Kwoniella dejecticola CBS 10117]OBR84269.1 hypothetical protein I303_05126 [Kwoniella dejecticola CBS 10117]